MRRANQEHDLRIRRPQNDAFPRTFHLVAGRDPKNIGANVRRLRTRAGLTQGQLAERAEIADATISRVERNRLEPSSDLLAKLAGALHVKADDLLGTPKETAKPKFRASVAKLVAVVEALDDAQVDDVTRAIKLLLAAGRRSARPR